MSAAVQYRVRPLTRDAWEGLARRFSDLSYRQLWSFGVACAERLGAVSEHIAIVAGDELIGLADVRCKRLPVIGGGVAYVNGGPLVGDDDAGAADRFRVSLEALIAEYVHRRRMVFRVAPPLGTTEWNDRRAGICAALGFARAALRVYRTLVVDIRPPLSEIRSALVQKWRNCLNRAERNGLELRSGVGDELFGDFVSLYDELVSRKQFSTDLDAAFYQAVQRTASVGEQFHVAIAYREQQPAAGIVASLVGDTAVYLLGASNATGMQQKASYLLQWHMIEQARERGCRWYDLGGIDPEANPGVYHFKQGLGGVDIAAPGPFELQPGALSGGVVTVAERAYRWWRRARAGGGSASNGRPDDTGDRRASTS